MVVGVSGGPDSVCLLHVLHSLSNLLNIKLYPIHINHMLRGDNARGDEEYTERLCKELGLTLSTVCIDVAAFARENGMSIETAGREVRYKEFDDYAKRVKAEKIAVAHNKNDQAETVMMHIIRGSGLAGLIGMEYKRGSIIRPLLDIGREEIEMYCNEVKLTPRTDESNLQGEYARNRVRLELFPYIDKSFGADITRSLCRLSELATDDDSFIEQCALEAYEHCLSNKPSKQAEFDIASLKQLHPAILGRVLKRAITDVSGDIDGIGRIHYKMLSDLIDAGKTGSVAELPNGIRGLISYGVLKIYIYNENKKSIAFDKQIVIPGSTIIEQTGDMVSASVVKRQAVDKCVPVSYNSLVQLFDYDTINMGINLRSRRAGDIFKPIGSNGTKKLKEYFIDIKIPKDQRDEIPLLCVENEVIWIVGYKISDKFKVTENTSNILKIEYNRRVSL